MGQDGSPTHKRTSGINTELPTPSVSITGGRTRSLLPRGWQIQKTFTIIKIIILCSFFTILVLLTTIGIGTLKSSGVNVDQNIINEFDPIFAQTPSSSDNPHISEIKPNSTKLDNPPESLINPNTTKVNELLKAEIFTNGTNLDESPEAEIKPNSTKLDNPPESLINPNTTKFSELLKAEIFTNVTNLDEPPESLINPNSTKLDYSPESLINPNSTKVNELPKAEIFTNATNLDESPEAEIKPNTTKLDNPPEFLINPNTTKFNELPKAEIFTNVTNLDESPEAEINPNVTYTLGPKITNWDNQRQVWLNQNPGFPNTVNGKARIMLLTGSSSEPCDKPVGDYYLLKSVKNKIDYCRLHGIELVYNMANLDEELAGYWTKLPMIRKLLLSHPEIEWIWWMDSDAFFTDILFEIPLFKYKNHNLVIHGYPDLLEQKSWIALNTGSFLLRNSQWSLDLLDSWAPMGPKGQIRDDFGKILTANLKGRPSFEADDQSALIYLLVSEKDKWMEKVYVENEYYLHGFWEGLVDKYEEMMEKNHGGLGDERWPFVTHFVGCKPCGKYADYAEEKCFKSMERAFNFADNQVLELYGFSHRGLLSLEVKRVRNETVSPLVFVDKFDIRRKLH